MLEKQAVVRIRIGQCVKNNIFITTNLDNLLSSSHCDIWGFVQAFKDDEIVGVTSKSRSGADDVIVEFCFTTET